MIRNIYILFLILFSFSLFYFSSPATAETKKETEYTLAYPGILPDHPLYFLKRARDKITPLLISDKQKKIDYYLLQTDKGINATEQLLKKKDYKLAVETALKAEHNMTLISNEVKQDPSKITDEKYDILKLASITHQKYLKSFISSVPKEYKKDFQDVLYFSEQNISEITNSLTPANKK